MYSSLKVIIFIMDHKHTNFKNIEEDVRKEYMKELIAWGRTGVNCHMVWCFVAILSVSPVISAW